MISLSVTAEGPGDAPDDRKPLDHPAGPEQRVREDAGAIGAFARPEQPGVGWA